MTSVFGHDIRSEMVFLYVVEAFAVFLGMYGLMAWGAAHGSPVDLAQAGLVALMLALCSGLVSAASGLYQGSILPHGIRLAAGALVAILLVLLIAWASLHFIARPESGTGFGWVMGEVLLGWLAGVAIARLTCIAATRVGLVRRRILVFGDAPASLHGADFVTLQAAPATMTATGALQASRLRALNIWAVVTTAPGAMTPDLRRHCRDAGVRVLTDEELTESQFKRIVTDRLPDDWLTSARGLREGRLATGARRGLDILVGLTLIMVTLPVLLVTAALIRLESRGPVFYRQERSGIGGRVFTLIKFRSMVVDAEVAGVPVWAKRQDPRVTRVGRFIRLTRIDELPQILNVLRGDMSMVGPRPERPGFVAELGRIIPHFHDRACVRPGITGWAQVNYPYGASVEDARMKLAYDLYYIRNRSLFLDLLILIATVRVVLFQEGAR